MPKASNLQGLGLDALINIMKFLQIRDLLALRKVRYLGPRPGRRRMPKESDSPLFYS